MINKFISNARQIILDPERRDIFLYRCMFAAFAAVSGMMTVVNFYTNFKTLMAVTFAFMIVNIVCFATTYLNKIGKTISSELFAAAMYLMFLFFIIDGTPEGFSAFWAPLLPACGLLMFGLVQGILLNILMFASTVFLCWFPAGRALLNFEYSDSFLLRFPLLYAGYAIVGMLIGFILVSTQNAYYNLSTHDGLTGVLTRTGFERDVHEALVDSNYETVGFLILDLDLFKHVNDSYGHSIGDDVLRYAVKLIKSAIAATFKDADNYLLDFEESSICRWGGEEFAIFVPDGSQTELLAKKIIETFDNNTFIKGRIIINQTISIGAVVFPKTTALSTHGMCKEADVRLYEAKETGRDKYVFSNLAG